MFNCFSMPIAQKCQFRQLREYQKSNMLKRGMLTQTLADVKSQISRCFWDWEMWCLSKFYVHFFLYFYMKNRILPDNG